MTTSDFTVANEGGDVTAGDRTFESDDLTIVEHHRFEGMSDPDDSSVVYALEASNGLKGLLVDAYGAYANGKTATLLKHTKDTHGGVDDVQHNDDYRYTSREREERQIRVISSTDIKPTKGPRM